MRSDEFQWRDRKEEFRFLAGLFDIAKAKRIIEDKPREIVEINIGESGKQLLALMKIDMTRFDEIDLTVPIIVASIKEGNLPIDGWHRIAKAVHLGLPFVPGVMLTKEETKQVWIK
jgi:hypothetical protein